MRGMLERFARVALGLAVVAAAGAAQAQEAWFGDWAVGCDNVRSCTAIGVAPSGGGDAYVKVTRSGEPEAPASITVVAPSEAPAAATLRLAFDDPSIAGLPTMPLAAEVEHDDDMGDQDYYLRATLSGEPVSAFINALRQAERLTVVPMRGQDEEVAATVSLSGAVAAILFMDDRQKRAGTVTALLAKGDKPASSVPAPPPLPVIAAKPITVVIQDLRRAPKALPRPSHCPSDEDFSRIAARLSPSLTLWGTCVGLGAYNIAYDFYLVGGGKIARAHFELAPADKVRDHALVNPRFSPDTIRAVRRQRGIGDCGSLGEWAWDGRRFRLLAYAEMDDCRGILPQDWPTLYRAEVAH